MILDRPIVVAGAGSIGCFVGGMYAAAGRRVALLARPRVIQEIESHGLSLTSFEGLETENRTPPVEAVRRPLGFCRRRRSAGHRQERRHGRDRRSDCAACSARCRRRQLAERRRQCGAAAPAIAEARRARGHGAVQCGCCRRGTVSSRHLGRHRDRTDDAGTAGRLSVPGLTMRTARDIAGVQWGKLLVNLNNAINALSGLPLRQQLAQRPWRMLFADQIAEGWPRSGPKASGRCRRRRSRQAARRICCGCPTPCSAWCWSGR